MSGVPFVDIELEFISHIIDGDIKRIFACGKFFSILWKEVT